MLLILLYIYLYLYLIRFLVSSGKDRALCLFSRDTTTATGSGSSTFQPVAIKRSAHKRIVWDCWYVYFIKLFVCVLV